VQESSRKLQESAAKWQNKKDEIPMEVLKLEFGKVLKDTKFKE